MEKFEKREEQILDEREAAGYLAISVSGLRKWRVRKCGPRYARLGRIIRYRQSDLDAFIQSRIVDVPVVEQK